MNKTRFLLVVIGVLWLSACGTSERKSGEPWKYPDLKFRTVHYRADVGRWNVFQYQATIQEARQHREWMLDLLDATGGRHRMVIESRD